MYIPEVRQIRIFLALEQYRSFTVAARNLDVTQSAISHSIKSLESNLNCKLTERLGKKCILTPHGEVFLHHARRAFLELEKATTKIKTLNSWGYSSIKIGLSHTFCQHVIPQVLKEFYGIEKRCEIFITPGDTAELLDLLAKGEIDIAFGVHHQRFENDYQFVTVTSDELCFITSPSHPWCQRAPSAGDDYSNERYITYNAHSTTNQILNAHLSGIGVKQRAVLTVGNMESIKEMAAQGIGVGIVAEWVARDALKHGGLVKHPITPAPVRRWGYYMSNTKSLSLPEEKFIGLISKELDVVINS